MAKSIKKTIENISVSNLDSILKINELIEDEYNLKKDKLEEKKQERYNLLEDKLKRIKEYSTFDINMIGPVLADIFTLYRDQKYNFDIKVNSRIRDYKFACFKSEGSNDLHIQSYHLSEKTDIVFYDLIKKSDIIVNVSKHTILDTYDFLNRFVDYVIDYCIKNDIVDVDLILLKQLESEYIKENQEEIQYIQDGFYLNDLENVMKKKKIRKDRLNNIIAYKNID